MKNILVLILLCFLQLTTCRFNCKSYLDKNIRPLIISGKLVGKQKENIGCFGLLVIRQDKKLDTLKNICYCVPENEALWKYVQLGDSVFKDSNSLTVNVYRNDSIATFDYPCCSQ
ncbi:hypothetical protein L0U88_06040 [Flavihumibacter sp. RY-1]|uniref:Tissue inhibitor of metalloproteinase n=1 Tax=Flavihumibacter fluminis TaxID=2909236 RepID=A0ABS9BF08_9BACT|nr:hypothetical protein [Flavihumibacter fluminis]MCF1714182.1 hypothetical protein [Flavihumibacter fluminis]